MKKITLMKHGKKIKMPRRRKLNKEGVNYERMGKYFKLLAKAFLNLPKKEALRIHKSIGCLLE